MESQEKVIETIKKLLALADDKRNCSKAEAEAAALKAQELMAKYDIELSDTEKEECTRITISRDLVDNNRNWRFSLSSVVAENFRCKCFWTGNHYVSFFGKRVDVTAAKEVYLFLIKIGDRLAKEEVRSISNKYGITESVYDTFCVGFISGLKIRFAEQCRALAIVMDKKVLNAYEDYSKDFGTFNKPTKHNNNLGEVYQDGVKAGKEALSGRELNA